MIGCNFFVRLLQNSEPALRGICWKLPMGALIQIPHGEPCPMTPVKSWPKKAKSQQGTLHHSQLSPAPTAKVRQPGQTAPCYGLGKGLCPWGCVCTGLIMIWKNVWSPFHTLWITNRHSDPGSASITQRSVCWRHGCFNTAEVGELLGLWSFPSAGSKTILWLCVMFTDFQKENIPTV